ncbi:MAG: acyltransferase 3 [Gemmataceae bacterium]|nr:acyltransferase 3 [Gemmataceae bacterium]
MILALWTADPDPRPQSKTPTADGRPFFTRVESLRGLGALAVAGYHFTGCGLHGVLLFPHVSWEGVGPVQNALGRLGLALIPGHAALMVFFVISGFVLRLSLGHGPQKVSPAAAKFFLARIFRIYPVVVFTVVLTVVLTTSRVFPGGPIASPPTAPLFVANLLLLDVSICGVFWALQVEVLMAPVIVVLYFLERSRGPRVLLGVALATTVLAYVPRWAVWPPLSTNLFAFVLGMVVPTVGRRFATGLSGRTTAFWMAGAVTPLLLAGPCLGFYSRYSAVVEAYAAAVLISLVAYRGDIALLSWLDVKPLRLLGRSSGSYYVLHMATVPAALALAPSIIPAGWSAEVPAVVGVLVVAGWLVAIAPLAVCSFYCIEAPGIALGRRFIRSFRFDSPPVPRSKGLIPTGSNGLIPTGRLAA